MYIYNIYLNTILICNIRIKLLEKIFKKISWIPINTINHPNKDLCVYIYIYTEFLSRKPIAYIGPYANYSRLFFSNRFFSETKRDNRATSTSTLKRYRNQSIIRNNGFLKTTFHRPPPGGHVVSPHICQSRTPCSTASWTCCTSELSKGCLHVASYDVLDENNSLGYGSVTLGVTEGRLEERSSMRVTTGIHRTSDFPQIKLYSISV